ncbi:hypothetical protein RJT34_15485 [Clitoria ternatea]|uniref:Short-chain dehydrogenase/reductase n=1 Tax=Clitoria ternatea TaxID=43366 RepID=A0AAN9J6G5_CLITE
MAQATTQRYGVVTGANKGIGFATCKQLASNGINVVLTARDEKRGLEAVQQLNHLALPGHVVFHQLDITDSSSIKSLADFIQNQYGKLDILVNNAGIPGANWDAEALGDAALGKDFSWSKIETESYELTEAGVKTNYYGTKELTKALIPLLQISNSPTIVNVSSSIGMLQYLPNGWPKEVLSDVENLTEEKIDEVLSKFLKGSKEGSLEAKDWPLSMPIAYCVSKAAVNAYTRILAKKYPSFCINALCPGYVKTDINHNTGFLTTDEGAEAVVRLALLPHGSPSGLFFHRNEEKSF